MKHYLKKKDYGFTIIEVIIVLAIAALILLVVFLAVPALQRGQRNNARKTDASRLAAQLVDFTSNNQGNLPSTSSTADCTSVYNASASLAQLTGLTCSVTALGTGTAPAANTFYVQTTTYAGPATPSGANPNAVILVEGNVCSGSSATTATGATSKSMALLYTLESGNTYSFACVNPQ